MSLIEPLGVRILGVDFKETHLEAISRAIVEAVYDPRVTMGKFGEKAIKFGDLLQEDESLLSETNPETLKVVFEHSGLLEMKHFFTNFLESLSKSKTTIDLLSGFGSVTTEPGSLRVKFRNHSKEIEELKINLKKIWLVIRKYEKEIVNSFNHLAEFALRVKDQFKEQCSSRLVHIGLYGAAFVVVITSLWYSVAFGVSSGLSTIAQNLFQNLKAAWPVISFALFIICTIYGVMEASEKYHEAADAIRNFLS